MNRPEGTAPEQLLDLVRSALEDLEVGRLDAELPALDEAATDREREVLARLRELIVSQRRAALNLDHVASAISTAALDVRNRANVAAVANARVAESAGEATTAAAGLSESADRISGRARELNALIDTAAEPTANVAASGRTAARDTETLSGAVADVAESAATIASAMREVDRSLEGLAAELTASSGAVTSIDASIQQIDTSAAETSTFAEEMALASRDGRAIVEETAASVEKVATSVEELGRSIERLEGRSDEVTEITKIIQSIAIQAKLLALNASIQAAGAGEAGRGFAVVAREIKQLSSSTTASTREIEEVVRSIRRDVGAAAREVRVCGERARSGLQLARAAREALDAIGEEVDLIRSRVRQISNATSSQSAETTNVKHTVARVVDFAARVRTISSERSEANRQVVARAREIAALADRVRASMAEQAAASAGIANLVDGLDHVAEALEAAARDQSLAAGELERSVAGIHAAGREGQASLAAIVYTSGNLAQQSTVLEEEVSRARLPRPVRGGRLAVPLMIDEIDFEPTRAYSEARAIVTDNVFERLVATGEGGRIVPSIAERWEVSGDGCRYTFFVRPGVRFHTGREVTSEDVRYSFERLIRKSDTGAFVLESVVGAREFERGEAESVAGIQTPDDATVVLELAEPVAFFLPLLTLPFASIVPREASEGDPEQFARTPVGTGPFRVVDVDAAGVRLERFSGHRSAAGPYVDQLDYVFTASPAEALDGVLEGRFAFTQYVPRERLPELLASVEWRPLVQSITLPHCHYLLMNPGEGHLPDVLVRRAIAHAIDRGRLLGRLSSVPIGTVAEGLVPPGCPGWDPELKGPAYDPELARRLVEEAGYAGERPVDLALAAAPWGIGEQGAAAIVEDLAAVGLRAEPRFVESMSSVRRGMAYDIREAGWYGDYLDPDTFTFGTFHSQFGSFAGLHASREFDRMLEAARVTPDFEARAVLYTRIHHMFQELCPAVLLMYRRSYYVQSRSIDGMHLYPVRPTVRPRDIWVTDREN